MWHVQYRGSLQQGDMSFTEEEGNSQFVVTPWRPYLPSGPVDRLYDVNNLDKPCTRGDGEFTIVDEIMDNGDDDSDAYSVVILDDTAGLPEIKSISIEHDFPGLSQKGFRKHIESFQNDGVKGRNTYASDAGSDKKSIDSLYGNNGPILMACFVRLCLICHNVLTVWRVTEAYNDSVYWLLVLGNFFLIFEGQIIVLKRAGIEYSW